MSIPRGIEQEEERLHQENPQAEIDEADEASMVEKLLSHVSGMSSFWNLPPEDDDPDVLFENNWLPRGGGLSIFGISGIGKSSLQMQLAFKWARGERFLGKPKRPLKIAIIQAEDSRRDVEEVVDGMKRGFSQYDKPLVDGEFDWTDEKGKGCVEFWDFTGLVACDQYGLKDECEFKERLRLLHKIRQPDIIIINPIQSFCGGDVSNQAIATSFLRECLDPIAKGVYDTDGNEIVPKCSFVLFGHYTKSQSETERLYVGAGSHEWTDWSRAKLLMEWQREKIVVNQKEIDGDIITFFGCKTVRLESVKRSSRIKWENDRMYFIQGDGYQYWVTPTDKQMMYIKSKAGKKAQAKTQSKRDIWEK